MAEAMRAAVYAGRKAFLAGRMEKKLYAIGVVADDRCRPLGRSITRLPLQKARLLLAFLEHSGRFVESADFATVATYVFKKQEQIGDAEQLADLRRGVDHPELASVSSARNIQRGDGTEAGTVHLGNSLQVQQDVFLIEHELAHFIAKLHGGFAREFPLAFDDQAVFSGVAVHTEFAGIEEVLVGHKPWSFRR